ncbi:hypothetical protein BVX97_02560, partial [bacterium E08(2017)]
MRIKGTMKTVSVALVLLLCGALVLDAADAPEKRKKNKKKKETQTVEIKSYEQAMKIASQRFSKQRPESIEYLKPYIANGSNPADKKAAAAYAMATYYVALRTPELEIARDLIETWLPKSEEG